MPVLQSDDAVVLLAVRHVEPDDSSEVQHLAAAVLPVYELAAVPPLVLHSTRHCQMVAQYHSGDQDHTPLPAAAVQSGRVDAQQA